MPIRTLAEADAVAYWFLRGDALREQPLAFSESFEEHARTTPEEVRGRINGLADGSFWLGAFEDDVLVGAVRLTRASGLKERHKATIGSFYVRPEYRGRGWGRRLLEEVLSRCRALPSLEQVSLMVSDGQTAARELYRRLGFFEFGCEPRSLKVDGQYLDERYLGLRWGG